MIVSSNRSLHKKTFNGSNEDRSPDRDDLHDSSVEVGYLQTLKSNADSIANCKCKSPPSSIGRSESPGKVSQPMNSTKGKWKTSKHIKLPLDEVKLITDSQEKLMKEKQP